MQQETCVHEEKKLEKDGYQGKNLKITVEMKRKSSERKHFMKDKNVLTNLSVRFVTERLSLWNSSNLAKPFFR